MYSEIGGMFGTSSEEVASFLHQNNNEPVEIRINSVGGYITEGIAIYNLLKNYQGEVNIVIDSLCASIATIVALGGDNIRMGLGGLFMIHNPWAMVGGDSADFRKEADLLDKMKSQLVSIYMTKFNGTEEQIISMMDSETWLTDKEAMSYGFVNTIEQDLKMSASVKYDLSKYFNSKGAVMAEEIPEAKAEEVVDAVEVEETPVAIDEPKEEALEEEAPKAEEEEAKNSEDEIANLIQAGVDKEFNRREQISNLAFEGQASLVQDLINEGVTIEQASLRIITNQKELALSAPQAKAEEATPAVILNKLNTSAPKALNEGGSSETPTLEGLKMQYSKAKQGSKERASIAQQMSALKKTTVK
jgi:ATP-dependent Clp protease protease subunit